MSHLDFSPPQLGFFKRVRPPQDDSTEKEQLQPQENGDRNTEAWDLYPHRRSVPDSQRHILHNSLTFISSIGVFIQTVQMSEMTVVIWMVLIHDVLVIRLKPRANPFPLCSYPSLTALSLKTRFDFQLGIEIKHLNHNTFQIVYK